MFVLLWCLLQGRVDLCGLAGRNAQQHAAMSAYPPSDWSSSSVEPVGVSGMGPTPSIPSSYAPTVVSSPSLASAHQSSFDDSESTSLQECFDAATDLFMNHAEGASNANDSDDGLPMDDVEDASELLTAAAAAVAAAAISLPNFHDTYTPSNFPTSFQPKEEMASGSGHQHNHVLEMAAFQAAVQSVQALRQQHPAPSSSSSPIGDSAPSHHHHHHHRRVLPAVHGPVARQQAGDSSFRSGGYAPYPLGLPLGAHPAVVATPNFQTNPVASTSFAIPSTVIPNFPSYHSLHF